MTNKIDETNEITDVSPSNVTQNKEENNTGILNCLKEISNNINTLMNLVENSNDKSLSINETMQEINKTVSSEMSNLEKAEADTSNLKEHTLIISEVNKTVTLPYSIAELDSFLYNNEYSYSSYEEIINSLYTLPLSNYSNLAFSRFREAYNLVKNKEHGSMKDAIALGLEAFANYNLHPAVITACHNLNEFDVYLSCMEYNELNDFHFFTVEFDIMPTIVENKFNFLAKLKNLSKKLQNN